MSKASQRPYRKERRARQEQETRLRITEAAVHLHRTLGPANTGVTEVAKRAGVSRMTVYSHFPTEVDLFTACSTHWAMKNPFPDPAGWAAVCDPSERLEMGLRELYEWYGLKEDMLGKVLRDTPIVPSLAAVMDGFWGPYMRGLVEVLARDWVMEGADLEELSAVLRVAVDFGTWTILTKAGLDHIHAARLAAGMVAG
jgi:AcrR family transcriptional regulator